MSDEAKRQERQARVANFDAHERTNRILIVLSIIAVVGFVMWWQARAPIDARARRSIASLCAFEFKKARSSAETANVDIRAPIIERRTGVAGITCGELRRAGHLPPY